MVFKGLTAAIAALALSATPALAQANRTVTAAPVAPADESVDGESEMFGRGGFIIPLLAAVAVVLLILVVVDDDKNNLPTSP